MKCHRVAMPIARITSNGLAAIALLVTALWGCILTEHSITRSARRTEVEALNELRIIRDGSRRVNSPATPSQAPARLRPC